jgi:hypothetical protein
MAMLFRRQATGDDLEASAKTEALDESELLPEVPEFAVIVSNVSNDGWHMAALIGESANPDFYVRAVAVRWPFLIARPAHSNRAADKPLKPNTLSPTGTRPSRKLVVNWPWVTVEDAVSQLRFYVKRTGPTLFRTAAPITVGLTLKEVAWPGRRVVVKAKSNRVTWNPPSPEAPTSPPAKSS